MGHAHARAVERLGISPDVDLGWWFPHLLQVIREGGATLVQFGRNDCLAYDVPTDTDVYRGTVRVLVTPDCGFVITVLPLLNNLARAHQRVKRHREAEGKRRQQFFKRIEDDNGL